MDVAISPVRTTVVGASPPLARLDKSGRKVLCHNPSCGTQFAWVRDGTWATSMMCADMRNVLEHAEGGGPIDPPPWVRLWEPHPAQFGISLASEIDVLRRFGLETSARRQRAAARVASVAEEMAEHGRDSDGLRHLAGRIRESAALLEMFLGPREQRLADEVHDGDEEAPAGDPVRELEFLEGWCPTDTDVWIMSRRAKERWLSRTKPDTGPSRRATFRRPPFPGNRRVPPDEVDEAVVESSTPRHGRAPRESYAMYPYILPVQAQCPYPSCRLVQVLDAATLRLSRLPSSVRFLPTWWYSIILQVEDQHPARHHRAGQEDPERRFEGALVDTESGHAIEVMLQRSGDYLRDR